MNLPNLQKHIPEVQKTLRSFLTTLLGEETHLKIGEPEESTLEALSDELGTQVTIYQQINGGLGFAVAADTAWLPLLSQSMLGEAVAVGDEGYDDLSRELAGQGYGAVRTLLSGSGIDLPDPTFEVAAPGEAFSFDTPPQALWKIPFSLETENEPLTGFALTPFEPTKAEEVPPEPTVADLSGAAASAAAVEKATPQAQVPIAPLALPELGPESIGGDGVDNSFGLLAEVELEVTVELGRRRLPLSDILRLTTGSVIELEKLVGEALQIYANNRLIAEGEAVVIDEQFGIRITALSTHSRDKAFR